MASKLGSYDHLNTGGNLTVPLTMEQLVHAVDSMPYGVHRFLSELVRQRVRKGIHQYPDCKLLLDAIEDALEKGGY